MDCGQASDISEISSATDRTPTVDACKRNVEPRLQNSRNGIFEHKAGQIVLRSCTRNTFATTPDTGKSAPTNRLLMKWATGNLH